MARIKLFEASGRFLSGMKNRLACIEVPRKSVQLRGLSDIHSVVEGKMQTTEKGGGERKHFSGHSIGPSSDGNLVLDVNNDKCP